MRTEIALAAKVIRNRSQSHLVKVAKQLELIQILQKSIDLHRFDVRESWLMPHSSKSADLEGLFPAWYTLTSSLIYP